jgi:peptidoglycan/xylan/chitin deacetylase (PgdA/CDA1 family)
MTDVSMTHVGDPSVAEIHGNIIALNALAGIPLGAIKGFRAPYLEFSANTLRRLKDAGFTYDSSVTASLPVTEDHSDAFWPYTLDNGLANNCMSQPGICKGEPKLPGLWEIPMYAFFDKNGVDGPHLMDPWL